MKKNVEIKKIGINGEGIGYIDRKIVFVPGALPQEEVIVDITRQTKSYYEGKVVKILNPSKFRIKPRCRAYDNCQGCTLMHLDYHKQLVAKKEAVREAIRKYTNYDLNKTVFKDVIASFKQDGFITSVNLPIVEFKGKITFGIYQRESKYLTIMTKCLKHHPLINETLVALENILTNNKCKIYNDKFKTGLRFIKIKLIDKKIQLVFITGRDGLDNQVIKEIGQIKNVVSVYLSINTSKHQEFDNAGYTKLYGLSRLEMLTDERKYLVSVKSKLPENIAIYNEQIKQMKKMLENSEKIISLNCGIGLLEMQLDQEVVAIDEKKYHIEDAKINNKRKNNVTFVAGNIDEKIVVYAKKKIYDTLVIQNDRFGLSETVKNSIKIAKIKTIVYSCQSYSTLAKDLADLESNYYLEKIVALDSSCHNSYLTTIVKLIRK